MKDFNTKRKLVSMNFKYIAKNLSRSAINSFIKELKEELERRDEFNASKPPTEDYSQY
jgi:uncharacterized protein YeeX (DUF496 family)